MSEKNRPEKIHFSETGWRNRLSTVQYHILRESGTEPAFSGRYWNEKSDGKYFCAGCGNPLFTSDDKFESGCGWPSFTAPNNPLSVSEHSDNSYNVQRIEVRCAQCEGHLGHVFPDGPGPEGLRYCINSTALDFKPRK